MFKKMSVALLGSACTFMAGADRAAAFDNTVPNDPPAVLYQPRVPPAPVRVASNSNMGGGFIEFLFGSNAPQPGLFENVTWGTSKVGAQTRAQAEALGLRLYELAPLWDVDTEDDLARAEKQFPELRL